MFATVARFRPHLASLVVSVIIFISIGLIVELNLQYTSFQVPRADNRVRDSTNISANTEYGKNCLKLTSDVSSEFPDNQEDVMEVISTRNKITPKLLSLTSKKKDDTRIVAGLIPNAVHYVWFGKITFTFVHYLSFLSVNKFIKPDYIFIHGDSKIEGVWWKRTITDVPNIYFVPTQKPETAPNGKKFKWIQHVSDYVRVKTILAFGGIYLDNDILVLRSFDSLRNNSVVYPRENTNKEKIQPAMLLGKRGAPFLRMVLELYRSYRGDGEEWSRIGLEEPNVLARMYPHLIYVEEKYNTFPPPDDLFEKVYNWTGNYVVHLWRNRFRIPNGPDDIKRLNTTFGEVMRHIYFGKKDLIV